MNFRAILLLLVFFLVILFAAVNWSAFITPTTLSFLVATVEAPLGMIMLGLLALLTAIFLAYAGYLQTTVLRESRQHARELKAQRELAEKAETSRYSDLRTLLEAGLQQVEASRQAEQTATIQRLDRLEGELRRVLEQTGNTLAAYIGELEDRLGGRRPEEHRPHPH